MGRVIAGFLLAPLPFGLIFGVLAIVALPLMYVFALVIAVPLFLLFRWFGWLRWGHAMLVGIITAGVFVFFYSVVADPFHVEIYGPSNSVVLLGIGAGIGLLFWGIAIFQNLAFPQPRVNWFLAAASVAALAFGAYEYQKFLTPTDAFGVVLKVPTERDWIVNLPIRLDSGEIVNARAAYDTVARLYDGRHVSLDTRPSLFSRHKLYFVTGCRDNSLCE